MRALRPCPVVGLRQLGRLFWCCQDPSHTPALHFSWSSVVEATDLYLKIVHERVPMAFSIPVAILFPDLLPAPETRSFISSLLTLGICHLLTRHQLCGTATKLP